MATRPIDPRRLGVEAFARDGATLAGSESLSAFSRLMASAHPETPSGPSGRVAWQAHGELRQPRSVDPQVWLRLEARTALALVCQRCLGLLETRLGVDRWFRFARNEEEAEALDAQIEDDVLALGRPLDLHELIEDELLLTLPLVPRHERCPVPLPLDGAAEPLETPLPHPFAALASLRSRSKGDA